MVVLQMEIKPFLCISQAEGSKEDVGVSIPALEPRLPARVRGEMRSDEGEGAGEGGRVGGREGGRDEKGC